MTPSDRALVDRLFAEGVIPHSECDCCETLAPVIEGLRASAEWQPIETAPKDGTELILYSPDRCGNCPPGTNGVSAARWYKGSWKVGRLTDGSWIGLNHEPTHWRLSPSPPQIAPPKTANDT